MVVIYYSTDSTPGINKELFPPSNDDILYDVIRDQFLVFVKDIIFNKQDSDKEVFGETMFGEKTCYDKLQMV